MQKDGQRKVKQVAIFSVFISSQFSLRRPPDFLVDYNAKGCCFNMNFAFPQNKSPDADEKFKDIAYAYEVSQKIIAFWRILTDVV